MSKLITSIVIAAVVFAPAFAQDSSVISVETRLVQFNVVVSSDDGPAAGLKKEDFIILIEASAAQSLCFGSWIPGPYPLMTLRNRRLQRR